MKSARSLVLLVLTRNHRVLLSPFVLEILFAAVQLFTNSVLPVLFQIIAIHIIKPSSLCVTVAILNGCRIDF